MAEALCTASGLSPSHFALPGDVWAALGDAILKHAHPYDLRALACAAKAFNDALRPNVANEDSRVLWHAHSLLSKCSSATLKKLFAPMPSFPFKLSLLHKRVLRATYALQFEETLLGAEDIAALRQLLRNRVCPQLSVLEFLSRQPPLVFNQVSDLVYTFRQPQTCATAGLSTVIGEGLLSNLTTLSVMGCGVSSNAAISLFDAIGEGCLRKLLRLNISKNSIGDAGLNAFSSAFAALYMPNLEEINMADNHIGKEGVKAFSAAIMRVRVVSFTRLNLSHNAIGYRGLIALSQAMKPRINRRRGRMKMLRSLNLFNTNISDAGLIALARVIGVGSIRWLEELRLGLNQIGDAGLRFLTGAMDKGCMSELKQLELGSNRISDAGASGISRSIAMGSVRSLSLLGLSDNLIWNAGLQDLRGAIDGGSLHRLEKISVVGNPGNTMSLKAACDARGISCVHV